MSADPYVYSGTRVLRNRLGIHDADELGMAERLLSGERAIQLPPKVPISYEGYKALHRHLFELVYDWAGEPRTVNLSKGSTVFALAAYVDTAMEERFLAIQKESLLQGLPPATFATCAAEHLCEINAIHPFRGGNGRTQRAFLEVLAHQAGHELELPRIEPAAWHQASVAGIMLQYRPMEAVIRTALGMSPEPFEQWAGLAPAEKAQPEPDVPARPPEIDR